MRATKRTSEKKATAAEKDNIVIRDSFSMIKSDYDLIAIIKGRCRQQGIDINKSQILRAGLNSLNTMTGQRLLRAVNMLKEVRTGRPKIKRH
jgi:hypothetical protein